MNVWKPIALCSIAGLAMSLIGVPLAQAEGKCHGQPNMAAALDGLKSAKMFLDKAEHDKDGWRKAAIESTNAAIAATDRGCNWADHH